MLRRKRVATDLEYRDGREIYRVVCEKQGLRVPSVSEYYSSEEKVEGLFDGRFKDLDNGNEVLGYIFGFG